METTAAIADGLSRATTGPGTPDHMEVTRPSREGIWTIFVAMILVLALAAHVTWTLGWGEWPAIVAADRIKYLGWIGLFAIFCIMLLVCAVCGSRLGSVKASAGASGVNVDLAGTTSPATTVTTATEVRT
jgi:hypothetical protein